MYNTEFVCTYKQHDEDEKDDMYRIQLIQVYNLDKWDDDKINTIMTTIFEKNADNTDMRDIIKKARESDKLSNIKLYIGDDDLTIFKGMFQYELFDLIHLCICDLDKSDNISKHNKNTLINNL
jgi:hypothetical protein|tara:strand:+ start:635 stop:1003 length:369 start_codon:yes stop_codon:yes gene_type:complete